MLKPACYQMLHLTSDLAGCCWHVMGNFLNSRATVRLSRTNWLVKDEADVKRNISGNSGLVEQI
jgi:hypothetical protein